MSSVSLLRYPGSKDKLWRYIKRRLPDNIQFPLVASIDPCEYREPFVGSGAIALRILSDLSPRSRVWLNDKDYWLVCLWNAIRDTPNELIEEIRSFTPSPESFQKFKEDDGNTKTDIVIAGFRKLAIHQMSFSGFGWKAGSVIGGRNQTNPLYTVSCRWSPIHLAEKIRKSHKLLNRFRSLRITSKDFADVMDNAPHSAFCYLDPPYVEKGPILYKHGMPSHDMHHRLAETVLKSRANWLLSYDDHPLVREMYSGCDIEEISVTYSNATCVTSVRPKNHEMLIAPRRL